MFVIKIIIETQSETTLQIVTVEQGKKEKEMLIKQKDRIRNIHSKYMPHVENTNSSNLLKYLEYIGLQRYPAITDKVTH